MGDLPRYGEPDGDAEKRAYAGIVSEAFAGDFEAFDVWVRGFGDDVRVLRGDEVEAGLVMYRMGQYFGGVSVPTWGIAGVGVRPDLRAKGFAHEIMQANLRENFEHGPPINTLYPAAPKLYRNLGWEFAGSRFGVAFNLSELPVIDHRLTLCQGTEEDAEILKELFAKRYTHENGCLDRGAKNWERVKRAPKENPLFCYIAERDGVPEGYTLYIQKRMSQTSFRYDMLVRDFVATTPESVHALISHFARNRSVADRVQLFCAPNDPLLIELMRTQEIDVEQRLEWMLRMVRVKDALEARGYNKHIDARAEISVEDQTLPENNGGWTLELADGSMSVSPGGGGPKLDVRGLAALYTGCQGPKQLRAAGLMSGDETHDAALAAMFAGNAPWMPDFF